MIQQHNYLQRLLRLGTEIRTGRGRGGSHIVDIAFAFLRRYRWQSRLVPTTEMPIVAKLYKLHALVYTIDEAAQLKVACMPIVRRFPMT
jgi:hypothetical protein